MSNKARTARGSIFSIKKEGEKDYSIVGDLTSIGIPEPERDEIDVSTLDSAGETKEFILGAIDNGEFAVEGNYTYPEAGQTMLLNSYLSGALINWKIEVKLKGTEKTKASLTGHGYVKACQRFGAIEEGSLIPFSATIRVSGSTEFTPPTAS
jgi:hypothetical protein